MLVCVLSRANFVEIHVFIVQFDFAEVGHALPIRFQLVKNVSIVNRLQSYHIVRFESDAPSQSNLVQVTRAQWNLPALEFHDNLVVSTIVLLSIELIEL